ncbi:MAG: FAD-binding protein, partial [Terriglobales bacterium]
MVIEENIALAPHTTLGVGGAARWFTTIAREAQVPPAIEWARQRGLPWLALGGGSNLLVSDRGFAGLVLAVRIRGHRTWSLDAAQSAVEAGAGEDWDAFVAQCLAHNFSGLECLSGIPGTVGATPVQNVGAYGQEVRDTIAMVRAWD